MTKAKIPEYTVPNKKITANVLHALAEIWANKEAREYLVNARNIQIKSLKNIKNGTIEGDALELSRKNGRIEMLEELLGVMASAFQDVAKLKEIAYNKKNENK